MARHKAYQPRGVIPAVLLPFDTDLAIDEAGFRKHLRDVAAVDGLSAITINAHSTEVASCGFEEQRRILENAQDEIGDRLPLVNGVWADGSPEAAPRRSWCFRRRLSRWVNRRRWCSRISSASPMRRTSRSSCSSIRWRPA